MASEFIGGAPTPTELSGTSYANGGGARQGGVYRPAVPHIITTFVEALRRGAGAKPIALDFFGALPVALDFRSRDRSPPPKVLKVPDVAQYWYQRYNTASCTAPLQLEVWLKSG